MEKAREESKEAKGESWINSYKRLALQGKKLHV